MSKVLHILPSVSACQMDFRDLQLQGERVLGKTKKISHHIGQDLQTLPMIKFWDRHRCGMEERVGKNFMGLQHSQRLLTRCQRDEAVRVLIVEQCHATVHWYLQKEGRGKAVWCWGTVRGSTKVREVWDYLLTHISLCGWHSVFRSPQLLSWMSGSWAF